MIEVLKPFGYDRTVLTKLHYSPYDRPFLDTSVDFNISHADAYVVAAASQSHQIGIDIEPIKPINPDEFKAFFSDRELASIRQAPDPDYSFFTHWTKKEALIKADGMGMSLPVQEIIIAGNTARINNQQWFLRKLDIAEGYLAYLATNQEVTAEEVNLVAVDF